MKRQQTQPNYFHTNANQTEGKALPPWFPDYPEDMITHPCLIVLWAIINGYAYNPPPPELESRFIDRYKELAYEGKVCDPALIVEMAESLNPGANHDVVMAYIRGICDAFYCHQVAPLPVIEEFCQLTPRLREVKEELESAKQLAYAMGLMERPASDDPSSGCCN